MTSHADVINPILCHYTEYQIRDKLYRELPPFCTSKQCQLPLNHYVPLLPHNFFLRIFHVTVLFYLATCMAETVAHWLGNLKDPRLNHGRVGAGVFKRV